MFAGVCRRAADLALCAVAASGLAASVAAASPVEMDRSSVAVALDSATLYKLPEQVETIVVGNPIVADVTMLKRNGLVVITGKGFGQTNVIFLDGKGQKASELLVKVGEASGLVTVQRGLDRESYSCMPRCEPTIALGDSTKYLGEASSQISSRNSLAAPAAGR